MKARIFLISLLLLAAHRGFSRRIVVSEPMFIDRNADPQLIQEVRDRLVRVLQYTEDIDLSTVFARQDPEAFGWWPGPGGMDLWHAKALGLDYVLSGWVGPRGCGLTLMDTSTGALVFHWRGTPGAIYSFAQSMVVKLGLKPPPFGTWILFSYRDKGSMDKRILAAEFPSGRVSSLDAPKGLNIFPGWYRDRAAYITYTKSGPMLKLGTRLLGLPGNPMGFAASPDKEHIAVALSRNGNTDIYILTPKALKLQRVTQSPAIDTSPTWSPDGKQLVFVSDRSGSPQLWMLTIGQSPVSLGLPGDYNTSPDWSADGEKVAFQTRIGLSFRICVLHLPDKGVHCLPLYGRSNEDPSFSPDSRLIAFVEQGYHGDRPLMIWDTETNRVSKLTDLPGQCFTPAWESVSPATMRGKGPALPHP